MSELAPTGRLLETCDGSLSIAGTPMRCAAWWIPSLALCHRYGDRRGSTAPRPYVPGSRAYRRRRLGGDFTFRMVLGGRFDSSGDPTLLAAVDQMWRNFDELTGLIVTDPAGDGTVSSTFTDTAGTPHVAPVQVLDLTPGAAQGGESDAGMLASLVVHVPRGGWV